MSNDTKDPAMIRMQDTAGNDIFIERNVYRKNVLPQQFESAKGNPNQLYTAILMAIEDGFVEEAIEPARKLLEIDPIRERATTILGIALKDARKFKEAEELFKKFMDEEGETGIVLTNLAKVYAEDDKQELSEKTLWRALELEPNQTNALDWWAAIHKERGGEAGLINAMTEVSKIPGSWRANLYLARQHLENAKIDEAVKIYDQVLTLNQDSDALVMMTSDLGRNGYLKEILDLAKGIYRPDIHHAYVGFNLTQACIELGRKAEGNAILDKIEALGRSELQASIDGLRAQLK